MTTNQDETKVTESLLDLGDLRRPHHGQYGIYPCLLCGKATNGRRWWVHLHTSGSLIPADADVDPASDQGWFPVGTECARKVPRAYRSEGAK
jgi:hypothetical protein